MIGLIFMLNLFIINNKLLLNSFFYYHKLYYLKHVILIFISFYLFVDNNIQASHSQCSHERSHHFDGLVITAITIGIYILYYKDQHIVHFGVIGCSYISISYNNVFFLKQL